MVENFVLFLKVCGEYLFDFSFVNLFFISLLVVLCYLMFK